MFDNATGVGRRVCEKVSTTELFAAFSAHYNFAFSFCNADAGHEKGSVEAKVYRKELSQEMASEDVAEAQRQAREWLATG